MSIWLKSVCVQQVIRGNTNTQNQKEMDNWMCLMSYLLLYSGKFTLTVNWYVSDSLPIHSGYTIQPSSEETSFVSNILPLYLSWTYTQTSHTHRTQTIHTANASCLPLIRVQVSGRQDALVSRGEIWSASAGCWQTCQLETAISSF